MCLTFDYPVSALQMINFEVKTFMRFSLVTTLLFFVNIGHATDSQNQSLAVYLDCSVCDMTYLRSTFTSINYVRDRKIADLQIISNGQGSGSGGRKYVFRFIGLKPFNESISFELEADIKPVDTRQDVREKISSLLEAGVAPFLLNFAQQRSDGKEDQEEEKSRDKWNYWVFSVSSEFGFEKESRKSEIEFENEFRVNRVTEEWRIRGRLWHEYEQNEIKRDEGTFISSLNRYQASASAVKSIDQHFSVGIFSRLWSNSVNNIRTGSRNSGAVEFSFFPYRLTYKKEFTIAYKAGINTFDYYEETLYNQTSETLYSQSVLVNFNLVQPWGGFRARAEGFAYVHDFSKNRVELYFRVSSRIVQGLFLNASGELSVIHDQLYLPKGDASIEEILLNRKALATNFEYEFNIGISYVFGSIYNNIVNTRL